jgi:hypothetical protein
MITPETTELSGPGDPIAQPKQPVPSRQIRGCLASEDGAAKAQSILRMAQCARCGSQKLTEQPCPLCGGQRNR